MTLLYYAQADITDILFRGVHIKRFWVGEWLSSKSDVHKTVAVETVMQYLADGTIGVGEGAHVCFANVVPGGLSDHADRACQV